VVRWVVEILKTGSHEPPYTELKGKSLEEGMHRNVWISSFINIWQTIWTSQSLSATFVFFYALYLTCWKQCVKEIHVILGDESRSMMVFLFLNDENHSSRRSVQYFETV